MKLSVYDVIMRACLVLIGVYIYSFHDIFA